ncbi:ABC transporter permease [Hyphomicrobium sp. MC8b]|uniref:ABC transporter permease n=1 Tax=Hyphomicrobium sp. MC8b TaxID=300273 RepID=UPI00391954B0
MRNTQWTAFARWQAEPLGSLNAAVVATVVIFIAIPVVLTVIMGFNDGDFLSFPIEAFSVRWFAEFLDSPAWTQALVNSLLIACGAAIVSTISGTLVAYAFVLIRPARIWYMLLLLPLFMPGVVLALGIAISVGQVELLGFRLHGSRLLLILAHSLWGTPLVFLVMESVFQMLDRRILEASADLGASPIRTFFEMTLPLVATGLASSTVFAFVISLNEFVMALFLTTRDTQTLPVLMWLSLRSAGTPLIAVAAIVLVSCVIASLLVLLLCQVLKRRQAS